MNAARRSEAKTIVIRQLERRARWAIGYKVFGCPFRHLDWLARGRPPLSECASATPATKPSRTASAALRMRLWNATGGNCGLCGTMLARSEVTLDHVTPRSKGGKNYRNLLPAHSHCNRAKADRMPSDAELRTLDRVNARMWE